jgi:crotonobetainyl-CoA:carnitine CoA-transferase CaiB-like acyl-CoA transferase
MFDGALSWLALVAARYLAEDQVPERGTLELAGSLICYRPYACKDGWVTLGALEPKFWQGFCERIERPDLVPLQHAHGAERERVVRDVREVLRGRTRGEWLERFAGADVCLTTIYTPDEVASDPHVVARGEPRPSAAPALGADTDAVLEEAGITEPERARLRSARVI